MSVNPGLRPVIPFCNNFLMQRFFFSIRPDHLEPTFYFTLKAVPVLLSRRLLLDFLIVLPGAFAVVVHPFDGVFLREKEKPKQCQNLLCRPIQVFVSQKDFVPSVKY